MAENREGNSQLPGGTQGDNRKTQSYKPSDTEALRERGQLTSNDGDAQNVRDEATQPLEGGSLDHARNKASEGSRQGRDEDTR